MLPHLGRNPPTLACSAWSFPKIISVNPKAMDIGLFIRLCRAEMASALKCKLEHMKCTKSPNQVLLPTGHIVTVFGKKPLYSGSGAMDHKTVKRS